MTEAAQTQTGPWPSWRALLWAPALPGVFCCFVEIAWRYLDLQAFALISAPVTVVFGYGATVLSGLLHWPFWKAGWRGPEAYVAVGAVIGALIIFWITRDGGGELTWAFVPVSVLTPINLWRINYKELSSWHRVAQHLWSLLLVLAGVVALFLFSVRDSFDM